MRIPCATYRLQFHKDFTFVDGRDLVPYLSDLGITDLYSSPGYKARRGSSHGYDIANPLRMNPELGTQEDFDEMAAKLRHYGMGLLLDTVPNHMAASYENPWWSDVLENGQSSSFAAYFDIDWHPSTSKAAFLQDNRILLPVLADLYGNVLENGELLLRIEDTGMFVRYYDWRLPLDPKTYSIVLGRTPGPEALIEIREELERLPSRDEPAVERVMERRRDKEQIKSKLWRAYLSDPQVKHSVDESLAAISESADEFDDLLSRQVWRLAYWKIAYEEINYRRFFDITELVALRIESPEVFDNRHQKTLELLRDEKVTGLRIDHIDGLWDPECYLRRMQERSGGVYVVVEKVLGRGEELPQEWPVQGTTGYDFLNALNGIFVDPLGLQRLEADYAARTGSQLPFAELCYQCNKLVMDHLFIGDINALAHRLGALAAHHRQARDVRLSELREALVEVSACLPVYRTYIHGADVSPRDRGYIERTIELARRRTPPEQISDAAFAFIRSVLLVEVPPYLEQRRKEWIDFTMQWQQFTGPLMAKGLEDTAHYRYNALLSLNEVGGDPLRERSPFTLKEFHEFNQRRAAQWPDTLNATSTHDTKRSEDVRARLNVLTEMPEEWERRLSVWMEWNRHYHANVDGVQAPCPAEEILIYQTLLGAWPAQPEAEPEFLERMKEFLVKALREAKQNSSWIQPQEDYERAVQGFLEGILSLDSPFGADFREFQKQVAYYGALNGLSQLLVKITAPGVPDFYQGTELWSYTLVDPDNRRPVDYRRRTALLDTLRRREAEGPRELLRELAAHPQFDETKLYLTYKGLEFRRSNPKLFARGDYQPLEVRGVFANHVCAFARRLADECVVTVVPRWMSQVPGWGDTEVGLPHKGPWRNVLTDGIASSGRVESLLCDFPVALLQSCGLSRRPTL
jgi:(1->4)-alpha-D-glucan 1-alpha-D-glucosylmutase